MKRIKLSEIKTTWGSLQEIRRTIDATLLNKIITASDNLQLAFCTLDIFNFKKGTIKFESNSIEKGCLRILQIFHLYSINGQAQDGISSKDRELSPIDNYVKYILGFYKNPNKEFLDLEISVKSDLSELLSLISQYEQDKIIQDYKNNQNRHEHESKIKIDFYNRCIIERDNIVKYLSTDLSYRALAKARTENLLINKLLLLWSQNTLDKPYKWGRHRSIEFFDYNKINTCRHRLDEVYINELSNFEKLYNSNKQKFYKNLNKIVSPESIFHEINNYYTSTLPKLKERKPVFKELHLLFTNKIWYGFTALALTQVEGIFSDILHIVAPKKRLSSLSNKVSAIRSYYTHEERNLDYFEYHLPRLRNRFLHSGSISGENFQLIALDLLHDLRYVMRVFHSVNDPVIELNNALNKTPSDLIVGISSFIYLFKLVDKVNEKLRNNPGHTKIEEVLNRWDTYQKSLDESYEIQYYAENINGDIDNRLSSFLSSISISELSTTPITLEEADLKLIDNNKQRLIEIIDRIGYNLAEDYFYLNDIRVLVSTYKRYFTNCSKTPSTIFTNIHERNKEKFVKILLLEQAFETFKS